MATRTPSHGKGCVSELVCDFDVRRIGRHMGRQRYQRGSLKAFVPATKNKPKRQLRRGYYWARWYRYVQGADGVKRSPREKIITKDLANRFRIATDYEGPLTKADAQRILDLLIAKDAGTHIRRQIQRRHSRRLPATTWRQSNPAGARIRFELRKDLSSMR